MKTHIPFGRYIRATREEMGISLRRLAVQVGVSAAFLSKVELGETHSLTEKTIRAIARELGKDEDFMIFLSGRVPEHFIKILMARPLLAAEFMRHFQNILVKEFVFKDKIVGVDSIPIDLDSIPPQFQKRVQRARIKFGLVMPAEKGGAGTGMGKKREGKKR